MSGGRKSVYESKVKVRFEEIENWCSIGASEKEIIELLGISKDTFYSYKRKYAEFSDLLKRARKKPVMEIKAALLKRATGYQYEEVEVIEDSDGGWRRRMVKKTALPDPASAMILLKHWAPEEGWTNDPAMLEIRKRELELKEKQTW